MADLGAAVYAALDAGGRAAHRAYATGMGYFWRPCPLCGTQFGGHEWRDIDGHASSIPHERPNLGVGICPTCTAAGRGCAIRVQARGARGQWYAQHVCEHNRQALDGEVVNTATFLADQQGCCG